MEEFTLVIEHVAPVRVVETAFLLVEQKRIVVPAVPETTHDVDEFMRPPITLGLRQMFVTAEILCFAVVCRRDEIPARASAADEIERRKPASNVIGLVISGGGGADETDILRQRRQR